VRGAAALATDVSFLRTARRTLLPLPLIDRPQPIEADVFGEFESRPIASLRGKRIGVVGAAGGSSCVALVGVARAFEEAGIEPAGISACGGSAVWGAMWAGGCDSQEMTALSLSWRPQDHLDIQWTGLPRFALSALRGFTGLAKHEALEQLFPRHVWRMTAGSTELPFHTAAYALDGGRLRWFGSAESPEVTVAEMVRIALARPTRADAVRVEGELFADGGVVDPFPAEPMVADGGFDHVFGLDVPVAAEGGSLAAAQREELVDRSRRRLGERLTVLQPAPGDDLSGPGFYDMFLDRRHWPDVMRSGYRAAADALAPFRRRSARAGRGGGAR
jgi:predicted acylesterase/phospholipase RssA